MKHIQKLRKLILTFCILAGMSLTAYAADTTITWTNLRLNIVKVNQSYTQSGITVTMTTAPKSGGWMADSIMVWEGTGTFVFSSSVGNIKGVVITARNVHYLNNDWSSDRTTLTWSGTPASSVTLSGNQFDIQSISSIVFTIEGANVDVTGVTLNKTSTTLAAGGTETLTATVSPDGATDKTVTWSSDNTSIATVDANGKVTAVSAGTANITVTATNGTDGTSDDKTATCTVTVTADKTALNKAITAAETLYNSIKDNTNYSNIASALEPAINAAKGVAESDTATQNDVDAATTAITTAKTNAEAAKKDVDDTTEANKVSDLIEDLPAKEAITKDDSTKVDAAKAAYDALTADQKKKVSDANKQKLSDAIAAIEKDKTDTAAANAVIAKINALPATDAITSANKDAIKAARAAYDALTDAQKAKISDTVKNKLKAAETALVAAEKTVTVAAKADPSTTGTYYATFYDSTTSYTADCEVYYATANADGRLALQKAEGNVIKAGEGVILKATSETVTLTKTTTEANYDSLLTGSDRETTVENALVLSLGKNGVWFYKYSGTLGANKAYLAQ